MKKKSLLLIFFSLFFFFSCEQPLEEEEFPYELKLVIRALLEENKVIGNIYIGRTLPVGIQFNEDFAKVTDAVGAVVSDGIFYPLRHTGNGIYTTDSLIARRGKTYSLIVQWQEKIASAETTIPFPGSILSYGVMAINENGQTFNALEGTVIPFADESYAATWVLVNFNGTIARESENFAQVARSLANQTLRVRTIEIPDFILNSTSGNVGMRFYIYDKAFYDYFISHGSGQLPDAIFGQPGTNVRWNITGDGIGMFIGRINIISML
jgi:hypothetical protein